MKLWKISQTVNENWDTYDSAIVAAETEALARETNPDPNGWKCSPAWCPSPDDVTVILIGEAADGIMAGVIVASFNAG